jgi:hypothetical protein
MWKLRGCERCHGDLFRYDIHSDYTCLACGSDTTNGSTPSQRPRPKAPTDSERLAGALETFLAKLAAEGEA